MVVNDIAFEQALQMVRVSIRKLNPTIEELREHALVIVDVVQKLHGTSIDSERLVRELEGLYNVFQPSSEMLVDDYDHVPWLQEKQSEIEWKFWDRYSRHLRENEKLPPIVLHRLDESTRAVLSRMEDPSRSGAWSRRGLVAGQVQSGKTGHYIGLICRAIDSGYRVVVVLAGMDNNLRAQTQLRIDAGLLGFDTQNRRLADGESGQTPDALGAGTLAGQPSLRIASLTTSLETGDFNKSSKNVGIRPELSPLVAVVKKNVTVLKNLREWLGSVCAVNDEGKIDSHTLFVVDDEADSASVNTKKKDQDPAAVNREIRLLLNQFSRNAYVGYTATPFANIYIDPENNHEEFGEDLHPRSFIETLKVPSNYFGPSRLFGVDSDDVELPLHRSVDDHETWIPDKHKRNQYVGELPESLKRAIRVFVLARAARLQRGQSKAHNSMLIHVTRFNDVQSQVRLKVDEELENLKVRIKFGDSGGPSLKKELCEIWEADFVPTTNVMFPEGNKLVSWEEVEPFILKAIDPIVVRSINGDAKDVLDYFDNRVNGFNVIAIGGNKLSRGLTLEGLTVSYYLRTTRMFDTLLQMGRWFGYRPDYEDLCRLYTTPKLWSAYGQVTSATNEMYRDFDEMCELGKTPMEYGLKVRDSVEGMIVTSPNRMRSGIKLKIGFAGSLSPSTSIFADSKNAKSNIHAVTNFVQKLDSAELQNQGVTYRLNSASDVSRHIWENVEGSEIATFFDRISTPESAYRVNSHLISRFVRGRLLEQQLLKWTVLVASPNDISRRSTVIGERRIAHVERRMPSRRQPTDNPSESEPTEAAWSRLVGEGLYTVKTVLSPADESVDLTASQYRIALDKTLHSWEAVGNSTKRPLIPKGVHIREERPPTNGLLMLYLIESPSHTYHDRLVSESSVVDLTQEPLVGFAVSFPRIVGAPAEDYVVTQRFMSELRGFEDFENDTEDDA
jgi:hypothetical protein